MTSPSPLPAVLEQVEQLEARKAALQGVDADRTDDAGSRGSEHHSTHIDPTTGHPRDPFDTIADPLLNPYAEFDPTLEEPTDPEVPEGPQPEAPDGHRPRPQLCPRPPQGQLVEIEF